MIEPPGRRASLRAVVGTATVIALAWGTIACTPNATGSSSTTPGSTTASPAAISTNETDWQSKIPAIPRPGPGCFTAAYPTLAWRPVTCTTPPPYPQPPGHGPRPAVVGNQNDIGAHVPSGAITSAIGSFANVTGVTGEAGQIANSGPQVANAYTLQVNANEFHASGCMGSPNPMCMEWEQFVFDNAGTSASAYIQYWLIQYNAPCPDLTWTQFQFMGSADIYCYKDNPGGPVPVAAVPITNYNLLHLRLTASASAGGDSLVLSEPTHAYTISGPDVGATTGWNEAEFNVLGDGGNSSGGGQANFNAGADIQPHIQTFYGGTAAPSCVAHAFTGETNNLDFATPPPAAATPGPALEFHENSAGNANPDCMAATSIGDTHLTTFSGLLYDFQATGDFLMAQTDPGFEVQERQVSGAPTWPNAAVNHAVAARVGGNRVAVCTGTTPLVVNGTPTDLPDGEALQLPSGADILRTGNTYLVRDATGNSMSATVNAGWINMQVGLGSWPTKVTGLLANPDDNVKTLAMRDGTVLQVPLSFIDLYGRYGASWRVAPVDSLLNDCGAETEHADPQKPFSVRDLDPKTLQQARAACGQLGEPGPGVLDACTLDVAVLGTDKAEQAYTQALTPVAAFVPLS
jgi:hypothetical protein